MPMPKTTVNEDDRFVFRRYDVGATRQPFSVEAEAIPKLMKQPAHDLLRGRVLPPNPTHIPTAAFFGQAVSHIEAIPVHPSRTL